MPFPKSHGRYAALFGFGWGDAFEVPGAARPAARQARHRDQHQGLDNHDPGDGSGTVAGDPNWRMIWSEAALAKHLIPPSRADVGDPAIRP